MRTLIMILWMCFAAGAALAQKQTLSGVVHQLEQEGYEDIYVEIRHKEDIIRIRACGRDGNRQIVYEASTGTLLEDTVLENSSTPAARDDKIDFNKVD